MKVIDLIIELQKMPPNLEVVLDKTDVPTGAEFFILKGINCVEEVEIPGIGECVMLTPFDYGFEEEENKN